MVQLVSDSTILINIGFFMVLIGIIIFAIVNFSKKQLVNFKKCPFCAEMIKPEAIVCRYCGRDLVK